ncbi:MAG TPA: Uma2 family endonuclease [Isosphaeraceae bacterium]|nr:Uma2 family endonuclease [Isosphaeraceae bacterium]
MSHASDKSYAPEGIIPGEPTWDVTRLFPTQGNWSESEYLALNTNQLVEFSHGFVEFLPMPKILHQRILKFLFNALQALVTAQNLGEVLFMGVRVQLWPGKFREPDVVFLRAEHTDRVTDDYWEGADLVIEVVSGSDDDRRRDLKTKRQEYALAGIPEYWIVDPEFDQITVLTLEGLTYAVHGEFKRGEQATSKLLSGFAVDVTSALAAGQRNDGGSPR